MEQLRYRKGHNQVKKNDDNLSGKFNSVSSEERPDEILEDEVNEEDESSESSTERDVKKNLKFKLSNPSMTIQLQDVNCMIQDSFKQ